jgi:hypothetical protein
MALTYTLLDTKRKDGQMIKMFKQAAAKISGYIKSVIDEELEVMSFFYKQYA